METKLIAIDDIERQKEEIAAVGRMLREGKLVALPTETVYGLATNGLDDKACRSLYEVKKRPLTKPVTLAIADAEDMELVAEELNDTAKILAEKFFPGPVTLIVKKGKHIPNAITGGGETIGIRLPNFDLTRAVIRAAKIPIALSSANISGNEPPKDVARVMDELSGKISAVVTTKAISKFSAPSTVIDCTGEKPKILRKGPITEEMMRAALTATT